MAEDGGGGGANEVRGRSAQRAVILGLRPPSTPPSNATPSPHRTAPHPAPHLPGQQQVLDEERRRHDAHAVVHPAAAPHLTHRSVHQRVPGAPLAPGLLQAAAAVAAESVNRGRRWAGRQQGGARPHPSAHPRQARQGRRLPPRHPAHTPTLKSDWSKRQGTARRCSSSDRSWVNGK